MWLLHKVTEHLSNQPTGYSFKAQRLMLGFLYCCFPVKVRGWTFLIEKNPQKKHGWPWQTDVSLASVDTSELPTVQSHEVTDAITDTYILFYSTFIPGNISKYTIYYPNTNS